MKFNLSFLEKNFRMRLMLSLDQLGITESRKGPAIIAEKADKARVVWNNDIVTVYYTKKYEFFYGVKRIVESSERVDFDIDCAFGEFGVMLDCSRNAVRTVATVKKFIDNLALMGYNQLQLYTEDTYEIEGEPYFGYQRGRYSRKEIKEIDEYARGYDIELVPNVQTLAHLNQIFRWNRFWEIRDIDSILLIGEEKTYEFIDRMFASLAKTFTSRKLHIGLDEAHNVGRGKYLDKNGYKDSGEVMCAHIKRVVEIAKKYGFEPMMWADMFFRLANDGTYYVGKDAPPIKQEVIDLIPDGLRLVYWDYYQDNQEAYENMMERCKAFGKEVVFAGGSWTWKGFAPANIFSDVATNHAFNACKEKGIKNVFLTMWGDDGAECSPFATLSSLSFASDYAYGVEDHDKSFFALTGIEKKDFLLLDSPNYLKSTKPYADCFSKVALYNDPFLGIYDLCMEEDFSEKYKKIAKDLKTAKAKAGKYEYVFETLYQLSRVLEYKAALGTKTRKLYKENDKKALRKLAEKDYDIAIARLEEFYGAFEKQWYFENKGYGFEIQISRIGGLIKRLENCKAILLDYVKGDISSIEELECEILPHNPAPFDETAPKFVHSYNLMFTTGVC